MVKSAYIHIPFCKSKCNYCSFVSYCSVEKKDLYLKNLQKEIEYFYENELLKTLYIGGGTPSLLTTNEIKNIINNFKFEQNAEITTELNPEDVDEKYLENLLDIGVNRLSFGCQTFDDAILKQINRRHNSEQVKKVVKTAQKVGFDNISLDFIYGLPNQTTEMFLADLKQAAELGLKHISLYGLKIEEGCYFYKNMPQNLPDDDVQADMYLAAVELLPSLGFEHYEVSNFAKKNFESRHNLNYWENAEYYGFGAGAHGYKSGERYENQTNLEKYFEKPIEKINFHKLSNQEKLEEEIFLGLRKMSGLEVENVNRKFGINFEEKYNKILAKYLKIGLLSKTDRGYNFTPNGILVSNVILAEFLED